MGHKRQQSTLRQRLIACTSTATPCGKSLARWQMIEQEIKRMERRKKARKHRQMNGGDWR